MRASHLDSQDVLKKVQGLKKGLRVPSKDFKGSEFSEGLKALQRPSFFDVACVPDLASQISTNSVG